MSDYTLTLAQKQLETVVHCRAGSPRNWQQMMSVNYDEPLSTSDQPLAKLKKV